MLFKNKCQLVFEMSKSKSLYYSFTLGVRSGWEVGCYCKPGFVAMSSREWRDPESKFWILRLTNMELPSTHPGYFLTWKWSFMFHSWTQTTVAKVSAQSTILTGFSDLCSSVPLSSDPSCIIFEITIFPLGIFHFSNSIMAVEVREYFLPHEKQYLLNVNHH